MYFFLRFFVRQALTLYCYRIRVNNTDPLQWKGPLVIASNHPNAFFDAIILASCMRQPMYFLALGEVTDKWLVSRLLRTLHIVPVYQMQDNRSNQERNDKSFDLCADILSTDGIILIFSEGICENNWQLRPFKKGTARIVWGALNQLKEESPLRILPIALNYNSYTSPGKTVFIQCGSVLSRGDLPREIPEAEKILLLNDLLRQRISDSMLQTASEMAQLQMILSNISQLPSGEIKKIQDTMDKERDQCLFEKLKKPGYFINEEHPLFQTLSQMLILALPALLGWVLHCILYYPLKYFARRKTSRSVFYDSMLFTLLFLIYPFYWIVINVSGAIIFKNPWILVLLICMPLLAWTTMLWKISAQRVRNYFALSKQERKILRDFLSAVIK
jgi:1-acyl-sn-glycerol-3-phosphate acyltransferase